MEDISAGLSISVVKNALYKVIRARFADELGQAHRRPGRHVPKRRRAARPLSRSWAHRSSARPSRGLWGPTVRRFMPCGWEDSGLLVPAELEEFVAYVAICHLSGLREPLPPDRSTTSPAAAGLSPAISARRPWASGAGKELPNLVRLEARLFYHAAARSPASAGRHGPAAGSGHVRAGSAVARAVYELGL